MRGLLLLIDVWSSKALGVGCRVLRHWALTCRVCANSSGSQNFIELWAPNWCCRELFGVGAHTFPPPSAYSSQYSTGSEQGSQTHHPRSMPLSFWNLISEMTTHHLYCILFFKSRSLNSVHSQGKGIICGHKYQKARTIQDHDEGCHIRLNTENNGVVLVLCSDRSMQTRLASNFWRL